ncbi:MAG TPA: hypothetical protein VFD36_20045, partial [Kofleriaceae bacterium]|nr:hypothetical protein [Kofleriaceae bacterium]
MRARTDLAEHHLVIREQEQLDPEDAVAAEPVRDLARDALGTLELRRVHRVRLPALDVVAADLAMTDRITERGAARRADREHRDLALELDEFLDDHATGTGAAAGLGVVPALLEIGLRGGDRLALARR